MLYKSHFNWGKLTMDETRMLTEYLKTQVGFRGNLVTIDEFLDNPYYLGNVYTGIFGYWRRRLRDLYPNELITSTSYVVLSGCIGAGKSTISKIIMAYDMYKISMMKSPEKFFGIMATSGYKLKCFNVFSYKAAPMAQELDNLIHGRPVGDGGNFSPYFRDQMKYGNHFLRNLKVVTSSRVKDLISDDVPGFILSEVNDCKKEVAEAVLHQAENRLWARFPTGKNVFNHYIIDSSARSTSSITDEFIKDNPSAKNAWICKPAFWESREGMGMFGAHGYFKLYLGDSRYSPFVVKNEDDINRLELDPDQLLEVPMEYWDQAVGSTGMHLQTFIQDVCGKSTSSSFRFFTEPERVFNSLSLPMKTPELVKLDFYDKYDTLYDKLIDAVSTIPKSKKLYIGIDCGTNHDLFGLAVGYADGVTRYNENDGGKLDYLNIKIPIAIGISRYEGQETAINKVHDFILRLADDFAIGCVYTDQYQSQSLRQVLIQNKIQAECISIDRDDSAYMTLKRWIYMGLLELPKSDLVHHELMGLVRTFERGRYKVEKPRDGISHGDVVAAITHVVDQIVNLGPKEVLSDSRMSKLKYTQILESASKPKLIRPMM